MIQTLPISRWVLLIYIEKNYLKKMNKCIFFKCIKQQINCGNEEI